MNNSPFVLAAWSGCLQRLERMGREIESAENGDCYLKIHSRHLIGGVTLHVGRKHPLPEGSLVRGCGPGTDVMIF
jgi:hypothetical protein